MTVAAIADLVERCRAVAVRSERPGDGRAQGHRRPRRRSRSASSWS